MKILLCIAPWKHSETYTKGMASKGILGKKFGRIPGATPPLGLIYIATSLKESGHTVKIIDGIFSSEEEIMNNLKIQSYDLIAFSVNDFLWQRTNKLISKIKKHHPDVYTLVGGKNTFFHIPPLSYDRQQPIS